MIYFVQAGGVTGPIKIGYVDTPKLLGRRFRALQTGNHLKLRVIATMPGDRSYEEALHRCFQPGRLRGEWFHWDTPGLAAVIRVAGDSEFRISAGMASKYCERCQLWTVPVDRRRVCSDECAGLTARGTGGLVARIRSLRDLEHFGKEPIGA